MSIRVRLTLWYVGLLAVVLIAFDVTLYLILSYRSYAEVDRNVQDTASRIVAAIQAENNPIAVLLSGRVRLPLDVFSSPDVYWQVLRADGVVGARSDNLSGQDMPIDLDSVTAAREGNTRLLTARAGTVRLQQYYAPLKVGPNFVGTVEVGGSLQSVDRLLGRVRALFGAGTGLALVLAALGGFLLAARALRPVDEITQTALQISRAEDLGRRIERRQTRDELGRLIATFNEMLGRLEKVFRAQQHLVADVSHELRTPLTTIRGNIDLLRRGAVKEPESQREVLDTIESETSRMSRIVSALLFLAQTDAGAALDGKPVELDTVLLDVYRQAVMMANGVEVRLGDEDQAVVMGDEDRLRQLLLNLVDNAVKYTPSGGQVRLSLVRQDSWVKVTVADTGIGIADADLSHIFERFYRADKARSRANGGAGLGLAIVRRVAEAHGGRVTVESQPGKGSVFTVWLPLVDAPLAGTSPS